HPSPRSSFNPHHSDPTRGIRRSRLRVLDGNDKGIQGIRVVDKEEIPHPCSVKLPVGNVFAVGTPAHSIPKAEFFFIDPIKRTIDDRRTTVCSQLLSVAALD